MVLGMSVTSLAEEDKIIGDSDDRGTITVNGFEFAGELEDVPSGFEVYAYPIIKAVYDGNKGSDATNGSFTKYEPLYKAADLEANAPVIDISDIEEVSGESLKQVKITEAMLNAIIKKLPEKTAADAGDKAPVKMTLAKVETTGADGSKVTTFNATATVPVGSYLIMVYGAESKVYNPMVASVYYSNEDQTGNELEEGVVNIIGTNTWVKVSDTPGVKKDIVDNDTADNHGSANIGDIINYQVVINPVPQYGGEYPVLNVVDTLSKGLDFVEGSVEVKVYSKDAAFPYISTESTKLSADKYSVTVTPKYEDTDSAKAKVATEIKIDFVKDGVYALNEGWVEGNKAVITYQAKLNDNAAMNQNGNENNVKLEYTKDSKLNKDDNEDIIPENPPTDKTYTYTFDLDGGVTGTHTETTITEGLLVKIDGEVVKKEDTTDKDKITNVLSGAEFTLYTQDPTNLEGDALEKAVYKNASIVNAEGKTFDGTVTSDAKGLLPIRGLEAGTYYLKETKAPEGYSLNTHVFKIVITPTYYTADGDNYKKGQLEKWEITIDDTTTNTFNVNHQGTDTTVTVNTDDKVAGVVIPNTKLSSLPSTGGIGTTIFTIGGCAIMILAAGLYFASRRKSAK
jgi:LPXTG-motif cell wall-anchored protein